MTTPGDPNPPKPVVLVHRSPDFGLFFADRLAVNFSLLDPASTITHRADLHAFIRAHAAHVRLLLCLGPSPLDADTLRCLPALECAVLSSAGMDHVDLAECRRRGVAVTNAGEAFSEDAADYAVGLVVDVLRRVSKGDRFVRGGLLGGVGGFDLGSKLEGKRVGIIGLGSIGSRVAKRLIPFGCHIAYTSQTKKRESPFTYYHNALDLALHSDVLVACCSLTDKTRHIINKDVMNALGDRGVIVNVGRGALIDEKELVNFLVQGKMGGAGLDVFENEPNVPKELLELDNVVLSPHRAVLTSESLKALADLVVGNVEAFFSNKPLLSPVRLE